MSISSLVLQEVEVRILGFHARVTGPQSILSGLRSVLPISPSWANQGEIASSTSFTSFVVEETTPTCRSHRVSRDGIQIWNTDRRDDLVPFLEWAINDVAVQHLNDYYLLHAGAVAIDTHGVILPAASGSGKTTLVAGLLAAGCRYFSDEVAVLDPATGNLLPFAKSLYIRSGSRNVLQSAFPELAAAPNHRREDESVWYLAPRRAWLPRAPVVLRYVILPRFAAGARTEIAHLPRSAALEHLLTQSFNIRRHGAGGVRGLVEILQRVECYSLTVGDLPEAVATVLSLAQR